MAAIVCTTIAVFAKERGLIKWDYHASILFLVAAQNVLQLNIDFKVELHYPLFMRSKILRYLKKLVNWTRALWRVNPEIICEQSKGMGLYDFHGYPDSTTKYPFHFVIHECERCGKKFKI